MALDPLLAANRDEILLLCSKHGALNMRVFGSFARGKAGPESDLDLLVEMGPKRTPWFPGGLVADLEDLLGRRVDIAEPEGLHWYIRDRVLQEAVPL